MCFLSSVTGLLPWLEIWQHVYAAQNTQFAILNTTWKLKM